MTQSVSPPRPETTPPDEQDTLPLSVPFPRDRALSDATFVWLVPATILAAIGTGTLIRVLAPGIGFEFAVTSLVLMLLVTGGLTVAPRLIGGRDVAGRD